MSVFKKVSGWYKSLESEEEKWLNKGSKKVRAAKFIGLGSLIVLGLSALFYAGNADEREAKQDILNALDTQETVVFDTHNDCMEQFSDKLLCETSQMNAITLRDEFKAPIDATDFTTCIENFGSCPNVENSSMGYISEYKPVMSSWQALKSDITISAPAYKMAEEGQYLRVDGTVVKI